MTIILNLPAHLEEALKREAAESGLDVEAFVMEAVRSRIGQGKQVAQRPGTTVREFRNAVKEINALNPSLPGHVDDSRESFYD